MAAAYYIMIPISIAVDSISTQSQQAQQHQEAADSFPYWLQRCLYACAVLCFALANVAQHSAHATLANLRRPATAVERSHAQLHLNSTTKHLRATVSKLSVRSNQRNEPEQKVQKDERDFNVSTDADATSTVARATSDSAMYGLPEGPLFHYVSMPHYTAEIVIYLMLLCISRTTAAGYVLLWVVLNLCITGSRSVAWYRARFPQQYPRRRAIVIPAVF